MADEHKDEHGHADGGAHKGGGHGHGGGHGGGGHEEGHEGAPEWLISFADNVALMMGFFVILLAMNMKEPTSGGIGGKEKFGGQPDSRMVDTAIAVREAFNSPVNLNSLDEVDQPLIKRIKEKKAAAESHDKAPRGDQDSVQSIRPGDYYKLGGSVTFEESASVLSGEAREKLRSIAEHARGQKFVVEIRGHASAAESYPSLEQGFELSYRRAYAAAGELVEHGIKWSQIRIVASGSTDRVAPTEYKPDAYRVNQRAEIVLTDDTRGASAFSTDASER